MKEVILLLLKDVGAWGALGIGAGAGIVTFLTDRSGGKILKSIGIGSAVAFFCYQPELVLNKVSEILSILVNLFKIGG